MLLSRHTRRREFIALFGGAAAGWPLVARAQQGEWMRRIGVLMAYSQDDAEAQNYLSAFRDALLRAGRWRQERKRHNECGRSAC